MGGGRGQWYSEAIPDFMLMSDPWQYLGGGISHVVSRGSNEGLWDARSESCGFVSVCWLHFR